MRYLLSGVLTLTVYLVVTVLTAANPGQLEPTVYQYIVNHFLADTSSKNAVAAILLNYRMYDTIFEALILLTAIVGMNQFLPRRSDVQAAKERHDG